MTFETFVQSLRQPWITVKATDAPTVSTTDDGFGDVALSPTPIKVAWLCSWTDSATLIETHLRCISDNSDCCWNCPQHVSQVITVPIQDADYIIVLDDLPPGIHPNQLVAAGKKLVYIQREPAIIRSLPDLSLYHKAATLQTVGYHVATPWIHRPLQELLKMDWPVKTKSLVAICSGKASTPDQQWRLELIKALCQAHVDIDVYGRGLDAKDFNGHYKGYTTGNDKTELLKPYKFCLAVENSSEPGYFSEKVVDPLLMFTVPIYSGCPNIVDWLPNQCMFVLNRRVDIPGLVHTIQQVLKTEVTIQTQLDVTEARRRILLQYNIWPTVHSLLCRCH